MTTAQVLWKTWSPGQEIDPNAILGGREDNADSYICRCFVGPNSAFLTGKLYTGTLHNNGCYIAYDGAFFCDQTEILVYEGCEGYSCDPRPAVCEDGCP